MYPEIRDFRVHSKRSSAEKSVWNLRTDPGHGDVARPK